MSIVLFKANILSQSLKWAGRELTYFLTFCSIIKIQKLFNLIQLLAVDGHDIRCRFAHTEDVNNLILEAGVEISDSDKVKSDGWYTWGVIGAERDLSCLTKCDLVLIFDVWVLSVCRFENAAADQINFANFYHRVELIALLLEGSGTDFTRLIDLHPENMWVYVETICVHMCNLFLVTILSLGTCNANILLTKSYTEI